MKISSWPRAFSWPTYSASVAGRSERSICSSFGEDGLAEISRSVSTATPAFCQTQKKRPGHARPLLHPLLRAAPSELIDKAGAYKVDVVFGGKQIWRKGRPTGASILLPLDPHGEVASDFDLKSRPIGRPGALFVDVYSPAVQFSRELRVRA